MSLKFFAWTTVVLGWMLAGFVAWGSTDSTATARNEDRDAETKQARTAATVATRPKTDQPPAVPTIAQADSSAESADTDSGNDPPQPEPAQEDISPALHRVDDVLQFAREGLQRIENEIEDYRCTLVRRERVDGVWPKYYQRIDAKVRHEQRLEGQVIKPFALFLEFRNPRRMQGRQVLFVEDKWHGDLVARRGGLRTPNMTVQLDPLSPLAMDGNRYPITEFGIQKLASKLIDFMENDLDREDCEVKIFKNAKLEGRPCTHFQVREKTRRPDSRFRMARVLVDNEYRVPVYYAAFGWGAPEDDALVPLEEYAYINLEINVGLSDLDFDIANPDYQFQRSEAEPEVD